MREAVNLGGVGDAGNYLLAKWQAALQAYEAERARFMDWANSPDQPSDPASFPDLRAKAAKVSAGVSGFETAVTRIGQTLQGAGESWDTLRTALSPYINPVSAISNWLGLSSGGLAGSPALGFAGVMVLASAIATANYWRMKMRSLSDARASALAYIAQNTPSGGAASPAVIDAAKSMVSTAGTVAGFTIAGVPWYYVAGGAFALWLIFGRRS